MYLHSGNPADATAHLARASSLIDEGRTEVDLAPQVPSGHRGCANGRAAALKLSNSTLRQLPALAAAAAQMARTAEGQVLPEDLATFGLLVYHLDTGVPPPDAAVGAALSRIQGAVPSTDTWRIPGFRTFWVQYTTVDWTRYHLDAALLVAEFQTYLGYKRDAELNASNQLLGGIVGSEQAWENALGTWKATEQRWYTADQASIAEYDAFRTSIDAEKVLEEAGATLQNG